MSTAMKQLKKNDFLNAITEEPMTRGQLIDALEEYDFIDSWLTYLTEHFETQGKILVETDEDGNVTLQRKAKKGGAASREVFLVEFDEDLNEEGGYKITQRTLEKGETMDKDAGEATTVKRAVKNATSAIFAQYKADTAIVKALLEDVE